MLLYPLLPVVLVLSIICMKPELFPCAHQVQSDAGADTSQLVWEVRSCSLTSRVAIYLVSGAIASCWLYAVDWFTIADTGHVFGLLV